MRYRQGNCIPIEELIPGEAYFGSGRNFNVAIWTGKDFAGLRSKFNDLFIDHEQHWDTSERHGTFQPLQHLEPKE